MNGHPIREEDFELYALGVLAEEERQPIQAHIVSCPECSRKLAEARGHIALLALAAPEQQPPAGARQRLLEKIRAEKSALGAPSRLRETPPPAARWWNTLWAPAALALAVATVFLWVSDRRLDHQLQEIQKATATYEAQTRHTQALITILSAQDTMTVKLAPAPSVPAAWGYVKYNARLGMVAYTAHLPAPPAGKVYQMWLVPMSGKPVSAGVFMPAAASNGHMPMTQVPQGIAPKAFAVTVEPSGGMPQPTGPKVLVGAL